jgi:hypothetical protein
MSDSHSNDWPRHGNPALRGLRFAGFVVLGVVAVGVFALVFGWLVMLLWNWLMPAIFGLGTISYWQAFGLVILAKLIFGGVGGWGRHRGPGHRPGRGPWNDHWKVRREEWRWYSDFWREEGRESFDRYVERKRSEGGKPPSA